VEIYWPLQPIRRFGAGDLPQSEPLSHDRWAAPQPRKEWRDGRLGAWV